ncbi:MAG: COR domain-containing protein [Planctomycetia bacterium]
MSQPQPEDPHAEAVRRIRAAKEIGQWWLDLGDLPLVRVPDEIVELRDQLTVLALGMRLLQVDGDEIKWEWDASRFGMIADIEPLAGLVALASLNLWGCDGLTTVEPLAGLVALASLNLSRCDGLTTVEPLAGLVALASLDLSYCSGLTTVEPLAGLVALTKLNLYHSRATAFSPLRELLPQLHELKVFGSRFPDLHPGVCGARYYDDALDSVRAYYAALGPDAKPDADVKVFVLGNGRAGKTKLVGRLRGRRFDEIPEGSTHGVTVESWEAPADWGLPHTVRLVLWDFGGQEIYHGTHALFVRGPAIYILVYADETENDDEIPDGGFVHRNRRLPYWFDYLRQEAGENGVVDGPVLLVQTQCDKSGEADRPPFEPSKETFPRLSPLIHVSSKTDDGLDLFFPRLKRAVKDLLKEHPQPPLPASWAAVRDDVRTMQHAGSPRTLTLDELTALCDHRGCGGDARVLRDALHLTGVVFYREGVFDDRIIVDQQWALEAVYTLFTRDHKFQRKIDGQYGRFTREDLELYFWTNYSVADQRTFLGFMEQCGVCFRAKPGYDDEYEGEYVFPDKLEPWGADHEQRYRRQLADDGGAAATAVFRLLHDGISRTFLAKIGSAAGDRATYWRYGCHFFDAATGGEALVRADGNEIQFQTWSGRADELLDTLLEVLKTVPSGAPPTITHRDGRPIPAPKEDRDDDRDDDRAPEKKIVASFGPKSVFLSYRHPHPDHPGSDRGRLLLRELHGLLTADGWVVRLDERELTDGDSISEFIDEVRACAYFVPVFCGRYLDSLYTLSELFTFREKFAHDGGAFADRTATVDYPESRISDDLMQAEYVLRCRTKFAPYFVAAGHGALAPRKYETAYYLKSWSERLSEVLALLTDRLNTPTAADVADRLYATHRRLHPDARR